MASAPAPVQPKTCGSCSLCCKVFGIETLANPAGVWCPHCAAGRGCTIYDSRPQECRTFACQWLRFEQMPDSYRPDRTKVVLTIEPPGEQLYANCDPGEPMAWRKDPIYGFLKRYARGALGTSPDHHVYARGGGRLWLITPNQDLDLGLVPRPIAFTLVKGVDGKLKPIVQGPAGPA